MVSHCIWVALSTAMHMMDGAIMRFLEHGDANCVYIWKNQRPVVDGYRDQAYAVPIFNYSFPHNALQTTIQALCGHLYLHFCIRTWAGDPGCIPHLLFRHMH